MARNGPARGIKGAAQKFLRAKIGPVPVPVIALGAVGAIYLYRRGGLSLPGGGGASAAGAGAGAGLSEGASGSGGGGGGFVGGGGGGGVVGTGVGGTKVLRVPVRQIINKRTIIRGNVYRGGRGNDTFNIRRGGRVPGAPVPFGIRRAGGGAVGPPVRQRPPVPGGGQIRGRQGRVPVRKLPAANTTAPRPVGR